MKFSALKWNSSNWWSERVKKSTKNKVDWKFSSAVLVVKFSIILLQLLCLTKSSLFSVVFLSIYCRLFCERQCKIKHTQLLWKIRSNRMKWLLAFKIQRNKWWWSSYFAHCEGGKKPRIFKFIWRSHKLAFVIVKLSHVEFSISIFFSPLNVFATFDLSHNKREQQKKTVEYLCNRFSRFIGHFMHVSMRKTQPLSMFNIQNSMHNCRNISIYFGANADYVMNEWEREGTRHIFA